MIGYDDVSHESLNCKEEIENLFLEIIKRNTNLRFSETYCIKITPVCKPTLHVGFFRMPQDQYLCRLLTQTHASC